MNDFNEYNYLCHYGVIGMKWGLRRYQNKDGSLTPAGIQRYGSKKKLHKAYKKALKAATKASQTAEETRLALEQHRKVSSAYNDKLRKKVERGKKLSKKELKTFHGNNRADEIFRMAKSYREEEAREAVKSLVKEFGKESVKDIIVDSNAAKKYAREAQKTISEVQKYRRDNQNFVKKERMVATDIAILGLTGKNPTEYDKARYKKY